MLCKKSFARLIVICSVAVLIPSATWGQGLVRTCGKKVSEIPHLARILEMSENASGVSSIMSLNESPPSVRNLQSHSAPKGEIKLTWDYDLPENVPNVRGFYIFREKTLGDITFVDSVLIADTTSYSYMDNPLKCLEGGLPFVVEQRGGVCLGSFPGRSELRTAKFRF